MLSVFAVENYRSLRRLVIGLGRVTVLTGGNGSGKSSLYRALRLVAEVSRDGAVGALARQGGLASTLWAGPQELGRAVGEGRYPVQGTVRGRPVELRLGFAGEDVSYAVDFGLPAPAESSLFGLDPEIKRECVWSGPVLRPAALLADRSGPAVRLRSDDGDWTQLGHQLRPFDSMLGQVADPGRAPELLLLREQLRAWRFYDHLRTDTTAPARAAQVGTRTPVLDPDGADLPAALQTIRETGDVDALDRAVDAAFPGSTVEVTAAGGRFELALHQPGLLRPLTAPELSDGTLRFLLWVAALLTSAPPPLLVLNEPETSLHPQLLPALAALIADAGRRTQVVVVTHSQALIAALDVRIDQEAAPPLVTVELIKDLGQTTVVGQGPLDGPPWHWPTR